MNTLQHARPAAGWYRDPDDPGRLRWWDGGHWTPYTAPLPAPQPRAGSRRRSRFTKGEALALIFGLVTALVLALMYWSGPSLRLPGIEPGGTGNDAPPATSDGPNGPAERPASSLATDLQSAYAGAVAVEANCGLGCVGVGGGVAVGPDTILTAEHVVGDSTVVGIIDADGAPAAATVIATDPLRDLALLQSPGHGLPYVSVRDAAPVIGEQAHAVGSPGGVRRISDGIVTDVLDLEGDGVLEVQTNADIDPGNSGGPLLDANGKLLGIVVAEHERDDSIGWATSAADVRDFLAAAPAATTAIPPSGLSGPYEDLLDDLLRQFLN